MTNEEIFRERLRGLLEGRGVSAGLADALGVTRASISLYTTGKRKTLPTLGNLIKIADYFDTSLDYLVGLTDVPTANNKDEYEAGFNAGYEKAINEISYLLEERRAAR